MGRLRMTCLVGVVLVARVVVAQEASPQAKATARLTQRDPSSVSSLHGTEALFSVLASTSATEATASAGYNFTPQSSTDNTLSLTLTGPLAKGGGPSDLADLNGLVGTARASLQWGHLSWRPHFSSLATVDELCQTVSGPARARCQRSSLPDALHAAWDANVTMGGSWFSHVAVTGSQQTFEYREVSSLRSGKMTTVPYAASFDYGYYLSSNSIVQASVQVQRAFSPGQSTQLCVPIGTTGALRCDAVVLGRATETDRTIASVEWRYSHGADFALSPTLRYDLRHRVTAVEVPLWSIHDASGGLAGGVRLGYRSDTNRFTLMGFVGKVGKTS